MSNPFLTWVDHHQKIQTIELIDKIFIGRTCEGIDDNKRIIVEHSLVSRDHALITLRGTRIQITDTSKNGTWVNDVRMPQGSFQDLANGDEIKVGETLLRLICPDPLTKSRNDVDATTIKSINTVVTNLVADVRDFSYITQTEDSSKVYILMKELINSFSDIVHNFKGTIKDYAGDSVYAFWEHRLAPCEEQAELACLAAINQMQIAKQISTMLLKTNSTFKNLRLGWGITTGNITMSHYGSRSVDLALLGDCVNLAFRFSDIANKDFPSKIIICSKTAELIKNTGLTLIDHGLANIQGRIGQEQVFGIETQEF